MKIEKKYNSDNVVFAFFRDVNSKDVDIEPFKVEKIMVLGNEYFCLNGLFNKRLFAYLDHGMKNKLNKNLFFELTNYETDIKSISIYKPIHNKPTIEVLKVIDANSIMPKLSETASKKKLSKKDLILIYNHILENLNGEKEKVKNYKNS